MIPRYALLIGAMKCGTTALFRYLEQHPEIARSRVKEPGVLCDPDALKHGAGEYERLWDFDPARHRWALEASTQYSKLPRRMCAALPAATLVRAGAECKFIYIVRDPIARIRSHYQHGFAEGWFQRPIFEELTSDALLFSNYQFQITPYVLAHGPQAIRVVSFEEFCARPAAVLREICEFLGIDATFRFRSPGPQNSGQMYRVKSLCRLVDARGWLPEPLDAERCLRLSAAQFRVELERRLASAGHGHTFDEFERELERSVTPTADQVASVRAQLALDLTRFREDWGVDPWTGAVLAQARYRTAQPPAKTLIGAC